MYFWQGRYGDAIGAYEHALEQSTAAGIQLNVRWAHYNLAEAHYFRFKEAGAADDERRGDAHARAALEAWPASDPENIEAVRKLKVDVLGPPEQLARDRMLPARACRALRRDGRGASASARCSRCRWRPTSTCALTSRSPMPTSASP